MVDYRPAIVLRFGKDSQRRRHVDDGERLGDAADCIGAGNYVGGEPGENLQLDRERALAGAGDLRL